MNQNDADERVLHLVSPRPVDWDIIFDSIANVLQVPVVPYPKWLDKLKSLASKVDSTHNHTPVLSLVDFFGRGVFGDEITLETTKAEKASMSLARMKPLDEKDAQNWLTYWATERVG